MSNKNTLENKNARKQERLHHVAIRSPGTVIHPLDKVARKLREMPIDRVARRVARTRRAVRRGLSVLGTMSPSSKFRVPVEASIRFESAVGLVAQAELKRRADLVKKP